MTKYSKTRHRRKQRGRKKPIRPVRVKGLGRWKREHFQSVVDDGDPYSIPRHHWPIKAHVYWPELFPPTSSTPGQAPPGETLSRRLRINVVLWDEICSAKNVNWLISQVDGARKILGGALARDIVHASILRAYECWVEGRGRSLQSWVRLLSYQDLIHALDAKGRERQHYKYADQILRYSDERGERVRYFARRTPPEYPVRDKYEDPSEMLLNHAPEGFELHTTTGWSVCGGRNACILNPDQAVMRRPASHPLGYGVICLECYPTLGKHESVGIRKATPIRDLPYIKPLSTNYVGDVGTRRPGFHQDGSTINSR